MDDELLSAGFKGSMIKGDVDQNKMTYFVFRSWRLRKKSLTMLVTSLLVLSLLMERYCFVVTVYKTRYYGYVLILSVIFCNCIFNYVFQRMRQ